MVIHSGATIPADVPGAESYVDQVRSEKVRRAGELAIPSPARRLKQVRLNIQDLAVAKTNNLHPYLFRVLQQQHAVAEVQLSILVSREPGIPEDILESQIVEAFDQLGISVTWDEV